MRDTSWMHRRDLATNQPFAMDAGNIHYWTVVMDTDKNKNYNQS